VGFDDLEVRAESVDESECGRVGFDDGERTFGGTTGLPPSSSGASAARFRPAGSEDLAGVAYMGRPASS
jgi:hypothetical protein